MRSEKWFAVLLLLLFTMTAAAQDMAVRQGCRRGTPRPQNTSLRRGGAEGRTPGGDFYHGECHQLTVLVAYNDRSFKDDEAATMEQWNMIFNTENLSEVPFKGSIHDYFYAQSYGEFNVVFDLQYVQVSGDAEKYASTYDADDNSQYLVEDIMDVLKERDIDWSLYDWNGDGYINQLLIVYAGHGMNDSGGDTNLIWPHQWWMSEHLKDGQEGVYCEPIPVSYDDKDYLVDCYCALAELTGRNDYGSFGTICHEYSHCFGFPDFYYNSSYLYSWELMDYGNYNGGGYGPPCYSAHERWLMGWLTPIEVTEDIVVADIPALCDEPQAYLIRNDGCENEYYIVENRQQQGWDATLPGSGIVVFHIDYDPYIWTIDFPNGNSLKRYTIFPANNSTYSRNGWAYPYQANDSLTSMSKPAATLNNANSDGTKFMNKSIYDMKVDDGLASMRFVVDTSSPAGIQEQKTEGDPCELYRIGPVSILRYPDGVVRKVVKSEQTISAPTY
jgi:M6 family metalloprotease-like protein